MGEKDEPRETVDSRAAGLPGSEGAGVADLLFTDAGGKVRYDFTGKLSFSWPRLVQQTALNTGDEEYELLLAYDHGLDYGDDVHLADLNEDEESGTEFSRIDSSFSRYTTGVLSLAIADIKYVPDSVADARLQCPV